MCSMMVLGNTVHKVSKDETNKMPAPSVLIIKQ